MVCERNEWLFINVNCNLKLLRMMISGKMIARFVKVNEFIYNPPSNGDDTSFRGLLLLLSAFYLN